ncbi:Putative glucose-methanol-choline oxidoreductase [Kitasatospora sp. MMS16-BH015]|uniref:GMC family oxidoreductase n=1 Tax=Kitasatospora sp. MMS16-BH015 TaxID=2018025 RepID=UPI000CA1CD64|nr:GMC family oxidoreductase [Kitasatospora sp. MMS16-BH015]AUG80660.1 Putative glucose-methanol-choline oxidoreductase [Kitasatospora sp. MMS16-BH015]
MAEQTYDVVVVGAGIAGSLLAGQLGARGWRVLVLEAGTGGGDPAREQAEALARYRGAPAKVPSAALAANPAVPSPDVPELTGLPDGGYRAEGYLRQQGPQPYASGYLRVNGGTGTAWTGLTPRMHPEDFRTGAFGYGRDWPLDYLELEPWYRAAERELGVAADAAEQRAEVGLPLPEGYEFPLPAVAASHLDQLLAERLDGAAVQDPYLQHPTGLKVVGTPHARNTKATEQYGPACQGSASCIPVCPTQAKYTPARTQAGWSAGVRLRTRAVATRVLVDATGLAAGVSYRGYDEQGRPDPTERTARAGLVVLAAHAIENARLLLASPVADASGQLGRNLMDHPVLLTWGLMDRQVGPYRGPGSTSGFEGFRFGAGRAARAPFRIEIGNWGWGWAAGPPGLELDALLRTGDPAFPDGRGLFGKALREAVGDRVGRQFALQFELEQEADPANRVTLDHRHPDAFGQPRPLIDYRLSEHVKRGIAAAKAVSDQLFTLLGAEDHSSYRPGPANPGWYEYQGRPYVYRGAGHAGGTHVMGRHPGDSVVDSFQRCWSHPNLYAVGCGSMPSLGTSNPTLTMAALALRTADRIHGELTSARRSLTTSRSAVTRESGPTEETAAR